MAEKKLDAWEAIEAHARAAGEALAAQLRAAPCQEDAMAVAKGWNTPPESLGSKPLNIWAQAFAEAFASGCAQDGSSERVGQWLGKLGGTQLGGALRGWLTFAYSPEEDWEPISASWSPRGEAGQEHLLFREGEGFGALANAMGRLDEVLAEGSEASPFSLCAFHAVDHPGVLDEWPRGFRCGGAFFAPKQLFLGCDNPEDVQRAAARHALSCMDGGSDSPPSLDYAQVRDLALRHGLAGLGEILEEGDPYFLDSLPLWAKLAGMEEAEFESAWRSRVGRGMEAIATPPPHDPKILAEARVRLERAGDLWEAFAAVKQGLAAKKGQVGRPIWLLLCRKWKSLPFLVDCDPSGYATKEFVWGADRAMAASLASAKRWGEALMSFSASGPGAVPAAKAAFGRASKAARAAAADALGPSQCGTLRRLERFGPEPERGSVWAVDRSTWKGLSQDGGEDVQAWMSEACASSITRARGMREVLHASGAHSEARAMSHGRRMEAMGRARAQSGANHALCCPISAELAAFVAGCVAREARDAKAFMGLESSKAAAGLWSICLALPTFSGYSAFMTPRKGGLFENGISFGTTPGVYLHEWTHHFECACRDAGEAGAPAAAVFDALALECVVDEVEEDRAVNALRKALRYAEMKSGILGAQDIARLEGSTPVQAAVELFGYPQDEKKWNCGQMRSAALLKEMFVHRRSRSERWLNYCGRQIDIWRSEGGRPWSGWAKWDGSGDFSEFSALASKSAEDIQKKAGLSAWQAKLAKEVASPMSEPSCIGLGEWLDLESGYWIKRTEVIARGVEEAFEIAKDREHGGGAAEAIPSAVKIREDRVLAAREAVSAAANACELPWEGVERAAKVHAQAKARFRPRV